MKKLILILILFVVTTGATFANCNGTTCQPDAGGGCVPEPIGHGTGNNNWNCCHGAPGNGAEMNAPGCEYYCSDPANQMSPECVGYSYGAPINKGLVSLVFAGLGLGALTFYRNQKNQQAI